MLNNSVNLTEKEIKILQLIAAGKTNKEIGMTIFLSKRTVEGYRSNMMFKLDVKNTAELLMYGIRNKIIE